MHPNELATQEGRRHRRQFSNEYKAEVVASCQQRGVSVAAVARLRSEAAATLLLSIAQRDPEASVRTSAERALARMAL